MANYEQTRQAWEECAEAYDRALTEADMKAAEEALRLSGIGPGKRLLDIAAGPGALSIPAARLGAEVLAVDYSHAMVDLLARKARALGLSHLKTRWMDGTALDLPDESFDFACSELGIMLFPDRAKGLSEMARVVRRGGRGVMVTLGPVMDVEPLSLFFEAVEKTLPGHAHPGNSPLFCLQDLDVLRGEMEQAGFRDIQARRFENRLDIPSGDHLWETLMAGAPAAAAVLRAVPQERQQAIRGALLEGVRSRSGGPGPVSLRMTFNIAVGTKPA